MLQKNAKADCLATELTRSTISGIEVGNNDVPCTKKY
jgi:hypothetical protein